MGEGNSSQGLKMSITTDPKNAQAKLGKGKPVLRGVSHVIAACVALSGGFWTWQTAPTEQGRKASLVFSLSLVFLFTVSGLYHVINWQPQTRKWWRRLDHAAIFVQIAGTYTPICLLALGEDFGRRLLVIIWTGAALGIAQSLFWVGLPKPITACLYVGLGWIGFHFRQEILEKTGWPWCSLILIGGLLYTVGAFTYVLKWPNPVPRVFGYHEVFHIFVILAAAVHFRAVQALVFPR